MRWDSNKFAALRERLKSDTAEVQIRLDPRDLTTIFAWDPGNEKWVEGKLIEPVEAGAYNLDQWYYIDTRRKELIENSGLDKQQAILQAIADVDAFVKEIAEGLTSSKAYKRYLVNAHRKRSAWEMMLPEDWETGSDGPPGEHNLGPSPMLVTMQTGPFREPPTPPRRNDGTHPTAPFDTAITPEERGGNDKPLDTAHSNVGHDEAATTDFSRNGTQAGVETAHAGFEAPQPKAPQTMNAQESDEPYRPKVLRGTFKVRKRSETNSETDK